MVCKVNGEEVVRLEMLVDVLVGVVVSEYARLEQTVLDDFAILVLFSEIVTDGHLAGGPLEMSVASTSCVSVMLSG